MNGRGELRRAILRKPKPTRQVNGWEGAVPSSGAHSICKFSAGSIAAKTRPYQELACLSLLSALNIPVSTFLPPLLFPHLLSRPLSTYSLAFQDAVLRHLADKHNLGIAISVFFTRFFSGLGNLMLL